MKLLDSILPLLLFFALDARAPLPIIKYHEKNTVSSFIYQTGTCTLVTLATRVVLQAFTQNTSHPFTLKTGIWVCSYALCRYLQERIAHEMDTDVYTTAYITAIIANML